LRLQVITGDPVWVTTWQHDLYGVDGNGEVEDNNGIVKQAIDCGVWSTTASLAFEAFHFHHRVEFSRTCRFGMQLQLPRKIKLHARFHAAQIKQKNQPGVLCSSLEK